MLPPAQLPDSGTSKALDASGVALKSSPSLDRLTSLLYLYSKGVVMLALRLPEEIETRLDTLAKATGRTKSYYAREAILTHLEDLEDAYMAEDAYLHFKASGEKAIPLEDVMKEYGLEY